MFELPGVALKALELSKLSVDQYAEFWRPDIDAKLSEWRVNEGPRSKEDEDEDTLAAISDHLTNRVCSVPDREAAGGGIAFARWPPSCSASIKIHVNWHGWSDRAMGMRKEDGREQFQRALDSWMKNVDLRWSQTAKQSEAHCEVDWEKLSGNTLAWSHLANGSCGLKASQRYDVRDWNPQYFYLVVLHELGHLLGLHHNSGRYVMNPSIVGSLDGLTKNDIDRARSLGYGAPDVDVPTPGPSRIHIPDTPVIVDGREAGKLKFVPDGGGGDAPGGWDV